MAKPKRKPDDKAQKERFIEKARELGADESGEAFERAFNKVVLANRRQEALRNGSKTPQCR